MSVAIVGIIGVSKGYGGFETLAENLIGDGSPITTVYCASKYFDQKIERYKGTSLYYLPFDSKGFQKVFHTGVSMIHAGYSGHKVILALGVSAGLLMPIVRLVYPRMKLITNIDGLEWQRGKWNYVIRKVLKLSEILSVKYSNVVIADNEILVEYVSNTYQVNAPMIPYGGDHAYFPLETLNDEKGAESALSICRIVPENNVHVILETFAGNGNPITFIGNWDSSKYGRQLRKKFGHKQNIEMLDPIFDLHELALYRSKCRFYVHGHSVGGTNPALVEMMHFAKPIIAFDCDYNRSTMENNGRYFCDREELDSAISDIDYLSSPIGDTLREIAQRRYRWEIVRRDYFKIVSSCLTEYESNVRLD